MNAYKMPKDGYDWCARCNYLAPVAGTVFIDAEESELPLCADCKASVG